jgi:hypothetical protein
MGCVDCHIEIRSINRLRISMDSALDAHTRKILRPVVKWGKEVV